jgi:type IV pilus assembly protein PilM
MSRIVTLNIGASRAVLAEYAVKGKQGLTLAAYGSTELVGLDWEAEGSAEAVLVPALRGLAQSAGIKPGPLALALNGQMVFPRFTKFPTVPADKLEELVQYEVEQEVPFPVDEIVCDHQFLGQTAEGDTAAMIVAAKLEQVSKVTDAVAAAGFTPVVVDVGPMAVLNALKRSYPGLPGGTVVLDIGAKTTSLVLVENEKIYLRSIPVAGNAITKEIAQAFGCSMEEAEILKKERGYVALGGVTEDADEISDRVSKIVRTVLTRLHAEILRSINFYRSQQGGSAPSRMFLTGGSAVLPQIDEFFHETLKIDVDFLNPFGGIEFGPKIDQAALETDAFTLAESAGLALRATDGATLTINLMPPALVEQAKTIKRIPFLAVGAVSVLAALGLFIVGENRLKDVAVAETEAVQQKNNSLRQFETKLKAEQKKALAELEKCDAFQKLMASRFNVLRDLATVRRSLLPGMWVTSWDAVPVRSDEEDALPVIRVTVRGWRDALSGFEKEHSKQNAGRKMTAEEIVASSLKTKPTVVPESVKIVSQKDVNMKGVLSEFVIELSFAAPASSNPDAKKPSKKRNAKGKRR